MGWRGGLYEEAKVLGEWVVVEWKSGGGGGESIGSGSVEGG